MPNCNNVVVYKSRDYSKHRSIYYIPSQNANIHTYRNNNITVIFHGRDISISSEQSGNINNEIENRYYFTKQLESCNVRKSGNNFFYVEGNKFPCNLGTEGQKNVVVTKGNFTDSEGIHSVIGNNRTNHIEVSHASYVDGRGGNDVITAKNFTTIKGYFGDSIYGKGLVLLPINFSGIGKITHANNITNIYSKNGDFISVDKQTLVRTADGLFVTPTKVDTNTGTVTSLQVTKSVGSGVILDDELDNLRKIDNSNFNVTKQLPNTNYHVAIGGSSPHIFYPDKEHHNFYWEAPSNISHLYLFDERNANITIAGANGILDFSQLNSTLNDMPFVRSNEGKIKINKNGLHVTLLPDYKDVTVTLDGEEYYKLQDGELERDYCSHSLKIDGRFSVNGTDLLKHHNCFAFDSDKVLFLKFNNDLLLLSGQRALLISNYYSLVHENWDLSIELNNNIIESEEFRERADNPSSVKYYQPGEQGLQIYHNQPINKNDIGLIDLKDKSILDFYVKVVNDNLELSHRNDTIAKVENWSTDSPAREMMFAFNDITVTNSKCIASTCNPEDVMTEFKKEKLNLLKEQMFDAIKQDNMNEAEDILREIKNIDVENRNELTLLSMAMREGRLDIVMLLFDRQHVSIEYTDNNGRTPLRVAACYSNLDIFKFLLSKNSDIEAESNDLFKMIVAIRILREEIINQADTSLSVKEWAKSFVSDAIDLIKSLVKSDVLNDNYNSVIKVADRIHNFDEKLFGNIIQEVVNDVYGKVDTKKMISLISGHSNITQRIQGYVAVFDKMRRESDLNKDAVVNLAYRVKEVMGMGNYSNINSEVRSDLERLKSGLPESVKNLILSSKVCIKNVEYGRYLYSPNEYPDFQVGKRRYVFTWPSNLGSNEFKWEVELNGGDVYLKNVKYGRYLYSPNEYPDFQVGKRRYAFTWPSNEGNNKFKWKVEPNGDNVHLKNVEYGRYLCSPNEYSNFQVGRRRYVFTWTPGSRLDAGAWKIEDCSRSRRKRNAASLDTNIVFKENDDGFSSEMTSWYGNASDASGFDSNRDVAQRGRHLPLINKLGSTSSRILAVEEAATVNEKTTKVNEKRPKVEGDDSVDITIVDDNNVEITTTDEKVNKAKEVYHALKNDEIGYNKRYSTSVGSKPSSWMNGLFNWIKGSVGGLFGSSATSPEEPITQNLPKESVYADKPGKRY